MPKKTTKSGTERGKAKRTGRKLQLNKETIKDLSVSEGAAKKVKGGAQLCTCDRSGC